MFEKGAKMLFFRGFGDSGSRGFRKNGIMQKNIFFKCAGGRLVGIRIRCGGDGLLACVFHVTENLRQLSFSVLTCFRNGSRTYRSCMDHSSGADRNCAANALLLPADVGRFGKKTGIYINLYTTDGVLTGEQSDTIF